jgi:hypothetical protein
MKQQVQPILSRDGKLKGRLTGGEYSCRMEGCTGQRLGVRWEDKTLTYPCAKGMEWNEKRKCWQIL